MKFNGSSKKLGVLVTIIIYFSVKYLPFEIRYLLPLFLGIIGLTLSIYYYKKRQRYEAKLLLILSSLMIIIFLAYLEHKLINTSYLLVLYMFFGMCAILIISIKSVAENFKKKKWSNLIASIFVFMMIIISAIAIILVRVFNINL